MPLFIQHPLRQTLGLAILAALAFTNPAANAGEPDTSCLTPELLGFANRLTSPTYLKIEGDYAYIIDDFQELVILDISTPNFEILGSTPASGYSISLSSTPEGDIAYFSRGTGGFSVYDISDPTDPWFIRSFSTQSATNMLVHDNILYNNETGYMDIFRPLAPWPRDPMSPDSFNGTPIYINTDTTPPIAYTDEMAVLDMTDPALPIEITPPAGPQFDQFQIQGMMLYALTGNTINVYDITDPHSPLLVTDVFLGHIIRDFAVKGSIIYAASNILYAYDISNPEDPMFLSSFTQMPGLNSPSQVEVANDTLYITDVQGTLSAYQIPTNPVGTHATSGLAREVEIINNLTLVTDDQAGVRIFDTTDPSLPKLLSTYAPATTPIGLETVNQNGSQIAYVAAGSSGLDIVDITDPTNPNLIYNYPTNRSIQDVEVVGNLAYVIDRINGLHILNIADPSNPVVVSITDTVGWAEDITIHHTQSNGEPQTLALIPHGIHGLKILDVTDPSAPALLSSLPANFNTTGVVGAAANAGYLYTADLTAGYRVWDLNDPSNPLLLATINTATPDANGDNWTDGFPYSFHFEANRIFVANGTDGLAIFNNSDPTNPNLLTSFHAQSDPPTFSGAIFRQIAYRGNLAYVAAGEGGLRIIDFNNCTIPCLPDLNNDSLLNFFDISIFIDAYQSENLLADFNGDTLFNFFDIAAYLIAFNEGCP